MRRNLLGLTAIGFFGMVAIVCLCPPMAAYQAAGLVGLRVAMVLGAFWLAWPDLQRLPRWAWFALPIGLLAVIYARGILIYAAPLLVAAMAVYLFYRRLRRPAQ